MREEIKIGLQSDLTTRVSLSLCVYLSDEKPREYEIIDFFFLGFRVRFFVFFFLFERETCVGHGHQHLFNFNFISFFWDCFSCVLAATFSRVHDFAR